jgi:hypothetical protein
MKLTFARVAALAAAPLLVALGVSSAFAQPASGNPPPPKGFEADSVSFVSARTGFVLGSRGCSRLPCKALLEQTGNGGRTWSPVPVPAVRLVAPFTSSATSAVSSVTFATASDGWLSAPGLWATTTGGKHWSRQSVPGVVIDLVAADGVAFAISKPANGSLNQARLYENKIGSSKWAIVPGIRPQNSLTVSGHSVWAGVASGVDGNLWTSTDSGKHWTTLKFRCPKAELSASPIAAASVAAVSVGCSNQGYPQPGFSVKEVFTSANGGHTFHLAGQPPEAGQIRSLAMPAGRSGDITLAADSGASFFYQSGNGGKTWKTTTFYDGGLSFRDLAYVSATTGYAIHFDGGPVLAYSDGLLKTTNAGTTWKTISIP